MGFINNVQTVVGKLGTEAKKTIDSKKLEFKMQRYSKEITNSLTQIGLLVYEHTKNEKDLNVELLNVYCEDIYNTKYKLDTLEKELANIKKKESVSDKVLKPIKSLDSKDIERYSKIDLKEEDLKITRTTEGIKILKFCPECNTGNVPGVDTCKNCGHVFKLN